VSWYDYWFRTPIRELLECHNAVYFSFLFLASIGAVALFAIAAYLCMEIKDWWRAAPGGPTT
jgi:hypothetical protein